MALDSQALGVRSAVAANAVAPAVGVVELVQRLGYLQRDPLAVVCPSHQLVLWSRLGNHPAEALERALWHERSLFEYWSHAAAIVPTQDFSLHRWRMRRYGRWRSPGGRRQADWVAANRRLALEILERLHRDGPLPGSAFARVRDSREARAAWSGGGDHQRMLEHLWLQGRLMVAGRDGRGRIWDLAERWLPELVAEPAVTARSALAALAQRTLDALGVATTHQVGYHFSRGAGGPEASLELLVRRRLAHEVIVSGADGPLPGRWFASASALARWEDSRELEWPGRTTLLSPFDNLIIDRGRTELLFGFRYRMEVYVPRPRRRYGYYVLPILHGDSLVGRLDCRHDRSQGHLVVAAVHAEPGKPEQGVAVATRRALEDLATFLGAEKVVFEGEVAGPSSWRRALRG